jgi:hypothetical protein
VNLATWAASTDVVDEDGHFVSFGMSR